MVGPPHVFGCVLGVVLQGAGGLYVRRHVDKGLISGHPPGAVYLTIQSHIP